MSGQIPTPVSDVPASRIRVCNSAGVRSDGRFVLYWMTAERRASWNFALDRAVDWAVHLQKPLLIVEVLGLGNRWASERHHRFVLDGMAENARQFDPTPACFCPFIERELGEGREFFRALSRLACVVVADEFPVPTPLDPELWVADLRIRMEKIDGVGLLPMRVAREAFKTAAAFRRFLQTHLREHLLDCPRPKPFARRKLPPLARLPTAHSSRWKPPKIASLFKDRRALAKLPIDHSVVAVDAEGGNREARATLSRFLSDRFPRYHEKRGDVADDASSGLSPFLHFGHISSHEIFHAVARIESWSPETLAEKATGRREGWWGMSKPGEAFLDELITWRELGFNFCRHRDDYAEYASLPDWALATLAKHGGDKREFVYSLRDFEAAATHDPLWNAAQRQLVREGRIHNYLRMLWGKKILEWSATPQDAAATMVELNNKYALDGGDPNSYSGIFWVLGRYDRPWGPERPIFGTVRYMSSENTARKMRVAEYIEEFSR